MSTTIHLVRHAMHDAVDRVLVGRLPGIALSAAGRAQAAAVAARLSKFPVVQVQSSPQTRALQTARVIAWCSGVRLAIEPALDEVDFGEWSGRTFDALAAEPGWQHWNSARSRARPPKGESMREAQDRALSHLRAAQRAHPGRALVMVTHAEIIRAVVLACRELPLESWSEVDVAPASVTTVLMHSGAPALAGFEAEVSA